MLMAEIYSFIFLGIIFGLGFLSQYFLHRMNTKVVFMAQEERYPESFIGERAYHNLRKLNDFGPKVVGSEANEVKAANFILNQVRELKANASNPDDVIIDHQIASGLNFQNYEYVNLQNVVVKLQGETDHVLMINCHFDSVPGSPGGSDDVVNCAVMIEILRVLSKSPKKQRHSVVFLFNGSEEQGLQAAHAFITQNQWRQQVRAYLNLESTGSDGREILFRTGPKHDWLVRMYRESVPRPFGHSVSEELFESGVIPSATDFEIFRDYGGVPGLDFAYVENGWRYHTRYDSADYISLESVQHTGNNILALTKKIANSNELVDPPEGTYAIFFDYLGLFFVSYTAEAGVVTNYIVAVLAVVIPFILQTKFKLQNAGFVLFETIMSFVTIVLATVLSALVCWGMASIMNAADNTMSYFNTTFLAIGIYCSLALLAQIGTYHAVQALSDCFLKTKKYREASKRHRVKISLNGVNLFWSIITITLTAMGFRFGYITMILLFVSLCTYLLTFATCKVFSKTTSQSWILIHFFGHAFAFLFNCYMMIQVTELFIPITGKQFYENPDVMIALISVLWMVLCMSYYVPLTLLVKFRAMLYTSLAALFLTCTILAFTSVGFPFSDDQTNPRLQRFRTVHVTRTELSPSSEVLFASNTIMLYSWDRNGIRTLEETFGTHDLNRLIDDEKCSELFMCGFPHYPVNDRTLSLKSHDAAHSVAPTVFNLIERSTSGGVTRIEFSLLLKTLTFISVTPMEGLTYKSSSVGVRKIPQHGKDHYITTFTFGLNRFEARRVVFEFEGTPTTSTWVKVGVVTVDSTFDHGEQEEGFKDVMSRFPDYTFAYVQQADSTTYYIGD